MKKITGTVSTSSPVTASMGGGYKGDPGVSPTVSVEKTDGVATVTITDAEGEHTFQVNDGEKGDTGERGPQGLQGEKGDTGASPIRGTDYWTESDKTEIISGVLSALPEAEGVSY